MDPNTGSSPLRRALNAERLRPPSDLSDPAPAKAEELAPPYELTTDQCLAELRAALHGWVPDLVKERTGERVGWDTVRLEDLGEALYAVPRIFGDEDTVARHVKYAAEQFDAAQTASASDRIGGLARTFFQAAVAYMRQAQGFATPPSHR